MAPKIELEAAPVKLRVSKGESAETIITMHNRGQTVDQFTISVEGVNPEWFTLPVSSVALFPNDQDTVKILVHLPGEIDLKDTSFAIKVKVTSQENPADTATVNLSLDVDVTSNLSLELSPSQVSGRKGTYQATVNNPDAKDASVVLKASSSSSRLRFDIQPDNLVVPAGKKADSLINAKLGWIALFLRGRTYDFQVSLEPIAGFLKTPVTERAELTSVPFYSVFSKLRLPFVSRLPDITTFSATTDNKRDFQLKWQVQRAKRVQLDDEEIETQGVMSVRPVETKQYTLTATNRNGTVKKTVDVKPLPIPKAQTSDKIKISLSSTQLQIHAGISPFVLNVQVQNLSDIVDKFTVEVEGLDESWFSRSASSIALMPKTADQVHINFLPPKKKGVKAGIYPFGVTIRSQSASKESACAVGQLEILPATEVRMKVNPFRKQAMRKGTYRVNLANINVSDANLTFEASDLDEACRFEFKTEKLVLGAWNNLEVPLIVRPKRGSFIGEIKRFDITVTANIEGSTTPLTANCEFSHKPFLQDWKPVWRAIRTIIVIAIILVAIYFVLKLGGGLAAFRASPKDWFKNAIDNITSWFPK